MLPTEPARCRHAKVPAGLDAAQADTGLGVGQVVQYSLTVLEKRRAFIGQVQGPGCAKQELDPQSLFQRIQASANDGWCHTFFSGSSRKAAFGRHRSKGRDLFKVVHAFA